MESNRNLDKVKTTGNKAVWESVATCSRRKPPSDQVVMKPDFLILRNAFGFFLANDQCSIYSKLLESLRKLPKGSKWESVTSEELQQLYLNTAANVSKLLVVELSTIRNVIKDYSGLSIFPNTSIKKSVKVNIMNNIFGDRIEQEDALSLSRHTGSRKKHVQKLKQHCKGVILGAMYPKEVLAAAVCNVKNTYYIC